MRGQALQLVQAVVAAPPAHEAEPVRLLGQRDVVRQPLLVLGGYETACFAAMKAVEVTVRGASGLDNSLVVDGHVIPQAVAARDAEPDGSVLSVRLCFGDPDESHVVRSLP